jgi:hypothetical protein
MYGGASGSGPPRGNRNALNAATLPHLAIEPWQRIGGTFNLLTAEERR